MMLTLPDQPMPPGMTPEELRLELACALYARGKLTKVRGADFAGVDFFDRFDDGGIGAALRAELAKADPATVDVAAMVMAIDATFDCP